MESEVKNKLTHDNNLDFKSALEVIKSRIYLKREKYLKYIREKDDDNLFLLTGRTTAGNTTQASIKAEVFAKICLKHDIEVFSTLQIREPKAFYEDLAQAVGFGEVTDYESF